MKTSPQNLELLQEHLNIVILAEKKKKQLLDYLLKGQKSLN